MNNQQLDQLFKLAQKEKINFFNIESKFDKLTHTHSYFHINIQVPIMAMMFLLGFISILGLKIYQQNKIITNTIALEQLEELKYKRATALDNDYIYSILVSSYTGE